MTKRERWKSFFMSPNTWRGFQNICLILFGGISWIYGTKALKEISLHFYEYITKYHFHDDGALLSIVQHIDISAYNCIYYPQSSFRGRKDIILQQQVNISCDEKE